MHKIHSKEFTLSDFSHEKLLIDNPFQLLTDGGESTGIYITATQLLLLTCNILNEFRNQYIEEKDPDMKKLFWWQMIQLLPSSYNQKRTVTLNYQVLRAIYFARKNHKLDEWRDYCEKIEQLPYGLELICYNR